ncbi:MAG TPA: hypothetical protein DCZ91_08340 [Lachnospiraceae bacterium]|nr:hypothetical protein [Lachnospiraceae bacterium]
MKVLWLCNVILPVIARELHLEVSNKEGWLSGLAETVLERRQENEIELSVAFPMQGEDFPEGREIGPMRCYGFPEDVGHPEKYDENLEHVLKKIVDKVRPDVVHCFGTEYPHTLAMCRIFPRKDRLLAGFQGLCTLLAEAYFANLPEDVIGRVTLRDWLRQDSLRQQQEKFVLRGNMEREIVSLAGNLTGRTRWDRENGLKWNPRARYYHMNETLRPEFYGPAWQEENCIPHSIFLSQGDYPVKGLHYMLLALPLILKRYPDTHVYVAGNSLVSYGTLKQKLKISAYGKYLRKLMEEGGLKEKVTFLGKMNAAQMRDRYLESSLFVCPSSLENSPNSLGEAMLLGMPCVCANVGGIPSLFRDGEDGIAYSGFRMQGETSGAGEGIMYNGFRMSYEAEEGVTGGKCRIPERMPAERAQGAESAISGKGAVCEEMRIQERKATDGTEPAAVPGGDGELGRIAGNLANAVIRMWDNPEGRRIYCRNAKAHAENTHNREKNYARLIEIYTLLVSGESSGQPGNTIPAQEKIWNEEITSGKYRERGTGAGEDVEGRGGSQCASEQMWREEEAASVRRNGG